MAKFDCRKRIIGKVHVVIADLTFQPTRMEKETKLERKESNN
jgi:hypothetical protein